MRLTDTGSNQKQNALSSVTFTHLRAYFNVLKGRFSKAERSARDVITSARDLLSRGVESSAQFFASRVKH